MPRARHAGPPGAHDLSRVPLVHPERLAGDIPIGDRARGSFAHRAALAGRGLRGLFRGHQERVVELHPRTGDAASLAARGALGPAPADAVPIPDPALS